MPVELTPASFGLTKSIWRWLATHRNKTFDALGRDKFYRENDLPFHHKYNKLHPIQDFDYKFNSWGVRDDIDYDQFAGQKIILCVGDSFTMNVGGPVEHGWPRLLSKMVNIPVINLSIHRLGPESFYPVIEKMRSFFQVEHVLCMYNLLGDEIVSNDHVDANITENKMHILKKYEWPYGAHIVFDPPWAWSTEQLKILYEHMPDAHAYLKDIPWKYSDIPYQMFVCLIEEMYKEMATPKWPSIDDIYLQLGKTNDLGNLPISDADKYFFLRAIMPRCKGYFYRGRDYRHFSKMANQQVANYFYSKINGNLIIPK